VNEGELRQRLMELAGGRGSEEASLHPPFVEAVFDVHPEGYEEARATAVAAILGDPDRIFRPALGVPHIDIYRYPPTADRSFWCYLTNGMSDLPQIDADGSGRRTEILACTRQESLLAVDLVHRQAVRPFQLRRAVRTEAFALDAEMAVAGFSHLLVGPSPLIPELMRLETGTLVSGSSALESPGEGLPRLCIEVLTATALSADDFDLVAAEGAAAVCAEVGADPLFWLLDERFGLAAADDLPEPTAEATTRGLGCLEEATASPCPKCGGALRETQLSDEPDPYLVCRDCGWSRTQSVVAHAEPYLWAVERFREVLGAGLVDWDARPGGEGIVIRVNAPGRVPALVELKSPVFDINSLPDRRAELENKLDQVEEFIATGE